MRELLGLHVHLDEHVYTPGEDSLLLAEHVQAPENGLALDVGTGTGLAALCLARQGARAIATDVNPLACRLARRNARANGLRVETVCTDLADGLEASFDRVACNPPYLPAGEGSPLAGYLARALEAGRDGSAVAAALLERLPELLAEDGRAWLVVSSRQPVEELQARADEGGLAWSVVEQVGVGRFERLALVELGHANRPRARGHDR